MIKKKKRISRKKRIENSLPQYSLTEWEVLAYIIDHPNCSRLEIYRKVTHGSLAYATTICNRLKKNKLIKYNKKIPPEQLFWKIRATFKGVWLNNLYSLVNKQPPQRPIFILAR
jgi:hypothetical protein